VWQDGPLTTGVRNGAIVYLDEVVEARTDVLSTIHSLTDDRRELTLERTGETIKAPAGFMLMVSYNPSPHSLKKRLSSATQQRFVSLCFDYPNHEIETEIIVNESNIEKSIANKLVQLGAATRRLQQSGLHQGASTRCLINAARMLKAGVAQSDALRSTIVDSLTDDKSLREALISLINEEY
jgi:nitric oxide reductase NorQ protein